VIVNVRIPICLLWLANAGLLAETPAPLSLRDALQRPELTIEIVRKGRDEVTVTVQNRAPQAILIEVPAGLVWVSEGGANPTATIRTTIFTIAAGGQTETLLPAVALSAKNSFSELPCTLSKQTIPTLDPLLKYAATRDDLPRATAQLVALALIEDVTFASWQQFLAPQRASEGGPTPAEVTTAVDALGLLRQIAPERVFALANDGELKLRALRNPWSRAKAMQLYGVNLPDGVAAPDVQQLLHTKPGDNCPICRMRAQMEAPAGGL
jgi:hypothetical protein